MEIGLMSDRAKISGLDVGANLLGSKYFPEDLVTTCKAYDPKGILLGTSPLPKLPLADEERSRLTQVLASRGCLGGKKLLLCSGKEDKLVPYANTAPMARLLEDIGGVDMEDKVYEGVGHSFSAGMVEDAVKFLVKAVEDGPRERAKI